MRPGRPRFALARAAITRQQGGAERAAEVAERRDLHRRRARVVEQVRLHRVGDPVGERLAEAHAEPAADDHRLDVEQVDRRRDPGAERLDRFVDQLGRQLVVVLERVRPDPSWSDGSRPRCSISLNRSVLAPFSTSLARPRLHRGATGVGLHAARAARTGSARRRP